MSPRFTARGAVRLGLVLGLLVAVQANADVLYQSAEQPASSSDETRAALGNATFDFSLLLQPGTFRQVQDGPCYEECGATALLSWTTPGSVDAPDSSDGLTGQNGYRLVFVVDAEDDFHELLDGAGPAGPGLSIHVALEEGIERDLLLPR